MKRLHFTWYYGLMFGIAYSQGMLFLALGPVQAEIEIKEL